VIRFVRRLAVLFGDGGRHRLYLAGAAMVVLAVLEGAALVVLVPLLEILSAPDLHSSAGPVSAARDLFGVTSDRDLAVWLGAIAFGLYVLKGLGAIVVLRSTTTFGLRQEADLSRRLMVSYLRAPYVEHLRRNSAELVRTLTVSLAQIFRVAFVQCFSAIADLFSVALVGVILATVNPVLALCTAAYFAAVGVLYQRMTHRLLSRAARTVHEGQAVELRTIQQPLDAVKEVKLRGATMFFADEVAAVRQELVPAHRVIALASVLPRYVLELTMVGAAALIAAVAFATESTATATATLGLFLVGGFRMLAPLNKVIFGATLARSSMPSLEQVGEDLAASSRPTIPAHARRDASPMATPRVRLHEVSFAYGPDACALDHVTVSVDPGDTIGIVGPSGAGKSTLVDVILGLLEPQAGEVTVDERPLADVRDEWQQMVGYVPQSIVLFDDTVRANVALGYARDDVDDDRVREVLRLAQVDEVVAALPNGLDQIIGERGAQLSGGQRQRLGVARALYHRPQVVVFDEATAALDQETEFRLGEMLEELRGALTMLTIAHRLSTVRRCDRLWYLERGHVIGEGSFVELSAEIPGFTRMVELSRIE
jgi:ABC-type multidrug transport system fused ATPase/permease subunit